MYEEIEKLLSKYFFNGQDFIAFAKTPYCDNDNIEDAVIRLFEELDFCEEHYAVELIKVFETSDIDGYCLCISWVDEGGVFDTFNVRVYYY